MGSAIGTALAFIGGITFMILVFETAIGKAVFFDFPIRKGVPTILFRLAIAVFAVVIVYSGVRMRLSNEKTATELPVALKIESEESLKGLPGR